MTEGGSKPDVAAAVERLRAEFGQTPAVAVVLGSGVGHLADRLEGVHAVPFDALPGFPASTVSGHQGRFLAGRLASTPVILQCGRYHFYEGHSHELVVAPTRVLASVGVGTIVFTNAAGGIHPDTAPGDLVLLDDHLNLMFRSPLSGPVREGEERFPDMSAPYDAELQEVARTVAVREGIRLRRGVYAAVPGPQYETAAEIRMLAGLGADVVGMSTVPEVVTARAAGVRCLAFSMVTNKATGLSQEQISHSEVLEVGRVAGDRLGVLIEGIVAAISAQAPVVAK